MKWILLVALLLLVGCTQIEPQCARDECCHADGCILAKDALDCSNVICSMDCWLNTLDCGQGYCDYIDGECVAVYE